MSFTPELGQMAFSNSEFHPIDLNDEVEAGLVTLAYAIAEARNDDPDRDGLLISNDGCDPWESDTFAMRTYCWCDGDRSGHEDACPPNFEYAEAGFAVTWYKHVGRGGSQNRDLTYGEWTTILRRCLSSLAGHPADRAPERGQA